MSTGGKTPVRLSIYNQTFTLLVSGDPLDLEQAAHEVDDLMGVISRSGNMDTAKVAILACLHLQDRVRSLEKQFDALQTSLEDKTQRLTDLLDKVIENP